MKDAEPHLTFSKLTVTEIGELIDEHRDSPTHNKKGIYILECDKRSLGKTKAYGSNLGKSKSIPNWVWPAHNAKKRYYVGSSKRVGYRVLQHLHGDGAWFTQVFPPKRIVDIEWIERTQDNLQQLEAEKAIDLQEDNTFVYQN